MGYLYQEVGDDAPAVSSNWIADMFGYGASPTPTPATPAASSWVTDLFGTSSKPTPAAPAASQSATSAEAGSFLGNLFGGLIRGGNVGPTGVAYPPGYMPPSTGPSMTTLLLLGGGGVALWLILKKKKGAP